jgi:hypothetical protein
MSKESAAEGCERRSPAVAGSQGPAEQPLMLTFRTTQELPSQKSRNLDWCSAARHARAFSAGRRRPYLFRGRSRTEEQNSPDAGKVKRSGKVLERGEDVQREYLDVGRHAMLSDV